MTWFLKLTRSEARLLLRDRTVLAMGLLLPSAVLLGLGAIPLLREPLDDLDGMRFIDYYAPSVVVMAVSVLGLTSMPAVVATYRERGMLRRMRTTPVHPAGLLGAQLIVSLGAAGVAGLLVIVAGRLVYDIAMPQNPIGFIVAFVLGIAAIFAMGLVVAAVAPNARAASGMAMVLFMIVMLVGGVYLPRYMLPEVVARIGDYTPPGVGTLLGTWNGHAPQLLPLVIMGATTLVLSALAVRVFKWE